MTEQQTDQPDINVGDRFWIQMEVKGINLAYAWATLAHHGDDGWTSTADWHTAPLAWLTRRADPAEEVAHWKSHAEEAGAGFARVCRDYARVAARNTELTRTVEEERQDHAKMVAVLRTWKDEAMAQQTRVEEVVDGWVRECTLSTQEAIDVRDAMVRDLRIAISGEDVRL